ncbi:hypothetical protein P4H83_23345, partial [Paenibacillus favisporus]|uniref:hypothetical protein n=1 Tax=Paenibacillus favisporus TaxID=221028 RepID=UPI002DB85BA0
MYWPSSESRLREKGSVLVKKHVGSVKDQPQQIVFIQHGQPYRQQRVRKGSAEERQAFGDLAAQDQAVRPKAGGIRAQHPPEPLAVGAPDPEGGSL